MLRLNPFYSFATRGEESSSVAGVLQMIFRIIEKTIVGTSIGHLNMANPLWTTDTCLPRFTGSATIQSSHLLSLKNAVVMDLDAVNARLKEATSQVQAEMTVVAQQSQQRGGSIKAVEEHVGALRQQIEVIESELAASKAAIEPAGGRRQGQRSPTCSGISAGAAGPTTPRHTSERSKFVVNPTESIGSDAGSNAVPTLTELFLPELSSQLVFECCLEITNDLIQGCAKNFSDEKFFLKGRHVQSVMSDVVQPPATVQRALNPEATFENELTGQLREKQFSKCRQGRGEPIEAYYNRVRALASQAFRAEDRATIEKKTRDAFLDGLEDSIRYNVKNKNPRTSRAAFDEALRQEILRDDRAAAQQCLPTAAIFEEIRVLNDKWDNHHSQQRKPKFQGECFFCGISGHISRNCRRRIDGFPGIEDERAGQGQAQPSPSQRHTVASDSDIRAQLKMYRQQIAELQRLNAELLAESGRGRTTSCLSWPAAEPSSSVASTDRVNSARLLSAPLTIQIPVRINGFPVFALIDTGSTITVAGRAFATRIGIPSLYQASATHAIGLGGNEVHMEGAAFANICVGSTSLMHRIHFTTGACTPQGARDYHIILGNDFLSQLPRFSIDYRAETLHVGEEIIPIVNKSLLTAPALINKKKVRILVTNPSDCDIFLAKYTKAAEAVEVFEDENTLNLYKQRKQPISGLTSQEEEEVEEVEEDEEETGDVTLRPPGSSSEASSASGSEEPSPSTIDEQESMDTTEHESGVSLPRHPFAVCRGSHDNVTLPKYRKVKAVILSSSWFVRASHHSLTIIAPYCHRGYGNTIDNALSRRHHSRTLRLLTSTLISARGSSLSGRHTLSQRTIATAAADSLRTTADHRSTVCHSAPPRSHTRRPIRTRPPTNQRPSGTFWNDHAHSDDYERRRFPSLGQWSPTRDLALTAFYPLSSPLFPLMISTCVNS
uniref:CCHC-type domain-containing protein n=1 Tax=Caenorhabditis japonica TaxID=281687 RepID=A0A8R1IW17_CAEJA